MAHSTTIRVSYPLQTLSNGVANTGSSIEDDDDFNSTPEMAGVIKRAKSKFGTGDGAAVVVRNAEKWYKKGTPILKGFNMTVPVANIYGLLGSSGCGKTTVLSSIIGQRKLNGGDIWVFGEKPGSERTGIPGKNVGYMPQDISLYTEFSVAEIVRYFGTLGGMAEGAMNKHFVFLSDLLDLPDDARQIGSLSGGQQRRVSFAAALIHHPELLILDEPTVGVDALLRKKIWIHLGQLVATKRTTVIITTHYIEEAKQADTIGLMRNGRLLAEKSPIDLLTQFGETSLENIVLKLCRNDETLTMNATVGQESQQAYGSSYIDSRNTSSGGVKMAKVLKAPEVQLKDSVPRIKSMTKKNFAVLLRNLLLLSFVTTISAGILIGVCVALGTDPHDLNFGVINNDLNTSICTGVTRTPGKCTKESLSCHYLNRIDEKTMKLKQFETEAEAKKSVQDGDIWGYLLFPQSFSERFWDRVSNGPTQTDVMTYNTTDIIVKMDETNRQIKVFLRKTLDDAYDDFIGGLLTNCGIDARQGRTVLTYNDPVFGTADTDSREFTGPSCAIGFLFFFAVIPSSIRLIKEKKLGTLERTIVAGANTWEVMVAFSIPEFCVLVLQTFLCFSVIVFIFDVECKGNAIFVLILFLLSGYCGVSMGFLLGTVCTEEIQAAILSIAFYSPTFLLTGMIWPVEGLPPALKYVAHVLPFSLATESIRSVISRGWGFDHPNVWPGFAILVAYITSFFGLTILFHKIIKR